MDSNPLSILLIDDNEDDIVIVREAVAGSQNINIAAVAHDGHQGLAHLRDPMTRVPDLVLLDINMPRKNGFEFLVEIKADPKLRHLPVIMYTSSTREEDIWRAYTLGACSYIVKPVQFDELITIVRHLEAYWTLASRTVSRSFDKRPTT